MTDNFVGFLNTHAIGICYLRGGIHFECFFFSDTKLSPFPPFLPFFFGLISGNHLRFCQEQDMRKHSV